MVGSLKAGLRKYVYLAVLDIVGNGVAGFRHGRKFKSWF